MMWSGLMLGQLDTDRPDHTESPLTIPKNALQIETGIQLGVQEDDINSIQQILLPTSLFRYGIAKGLELRLEHTYESIKVDQKRSSGFNDLALGAKVNLLDADKTAIGFMSRALIPTGSRAFTNDKWGVSSILAISHNLNEKSELAYNLGYEYLGSGNGNLTYALVYGLDLNDRFGIYIEPYGEISDMKELMLNANTGLTYLVQNDFQLDFSVGTGINHNMNYMALGASWLIGKPEE